MTEWNDLIPKPSSTFIRVACPKCGNEQMLYSHAVNKVKCNVCGEILAEPTGGKARIMGDKTATFE